MRQRKFEAKITENKTGGEIFSWHIFTKAGDSHWSGMEIMNTAEMREMARVLLEKAEELDNEN